MNKSINKTIENLNRTASSMDDMEFLNVVTETQLDLLEVGLQGIHYGVKENTITPVK